MSTSVETTNQFTEQLTDIDIHSRGPAQSPILRPIEITPTNPINQLMQQELGKNHGVSVIIHPVNFQLETQTTQTTQTQTIQPTVQQQITQLNSSTSQRRSNFNNISTIIVNDMVSLLRLIAIIIFYVGLVIPLGPLIVIFCYIFTNEFKQTKIFYGVFISSVLLTSCFWLIIDSIYF